MRKNAYPEIRSLLGGVPPPPEHMSPEMVVVMMKLLIAFVVGGEFGDDGLSERIEGSGLHFHRQRP